MGDVSDNLENPNSNKPFITRIALFISWLFKSLYIVFLIRFPQLDLSSNYWYT